MIYNLDIAMYFEEYFNKDLKFPVYIIERPILGKLSEDKKVFTDYFNKMTYLNLDIAHEKGLNDGFNFTVSIKDLKKQKPFWTIDKIYITFWEFLEPNVYFYDPEDGKFTSMSPSDFEERYGVYIDIYTVNAINEINNAILSSDEKALSEYLDFVNDKETGKQKDKIINSINKPISETIKEVKKDIIAQDEAVKKLVTAIYKNYKFDDISMKSNILMYGPTGVGKTAIIKAVAKAFDIPVWIEDMTKYTETGYYGASVDDILVNLYINAGEDLEKAQKSILFLDEIDKKASRDDEKDFNKGAVLNSLLKIIEGGVFNVEIRKGEEILFDTSSLTVIAGGAFSALYEKVNTKTKVMGFKTGEDKEIKININNNDITINDFKEYGMPLEFLGRFKTIIRMNKLDVNDFVNILKNSDLSALKNYLRVLKKNNIDLVIPDKLYESIAKYAIKKYNTGARSLNIVIDELFEKILYDYFEEEESIKEIDLGETLVENRNDYKLIKKEKRS